MVNFLFTVGYFLLLLFLSAFFSASETAMVGLSRARVKARAKRGDRLALIIEELLKRPERTLSIILIGNNFVNVLLSSLATLVAVRIIGNYGIIYATISVTICLLLFSEITPKTFAAYHPEKVSNLVCIPLIVLDRVLSPVVWFTGVVAKGVAGLFGKGERVPQDFLVDEVRELLHLSGFGGESAGFSVLHGLLSLQELRVENIMVPVAKCEFVEEGTPIGRILEMFIRDGRLYVPVFKGSIDDVVGYLDMKELVRSYLKKTKNLSLRKFLREAVFVPEVAPAIHAFEVLLKRKLGLVFAVDEFGGISGVVFLEEVLGEIVGFKAYPKVVRLPDGSLLVSSSVSVGEIASISGIDLPPEDARKSLSSVILREFGYIPKKGEELTLYNKLKIRVVESTEKEIVRVLVRFAA